MYFIFIFISHSILKSSVKISVHQLIKHKRPKSESESCIDKLRQIVLAIHKTKNNRHDREKKYIVHKYKHDGYRSKTCRN